MLGVYDKIWHTNPTLVSAASNPDSGVATLGMKVTSIGLIIVGSRRVAVEGPLCTR